MRQTERDTGQLFTSLFLAYDDERFKQSVELFKKRFDDVGFDTDWFKGKVCLDVGCGGGRYSIALVLLGAARVVGIDLSEELVADARRRAAALHTPNVTFEVASATHLPFTDGSFDFICLSGVLMHTAEPVGVLRELARVVKPGGLVYMLVYATEGLRWPLVQMLRPVAQRIGFASMDRAVEASHLAVNRRRTYLDDLFVPCIDFYSWPALRGLLEHHGFTRVSRWERGRFDHESDLESYLHDLQGLADLFRAVESGTSSDTQMLATSALAMITAVIQHANSIQSLLREGVLSEPDARVMAIGQGHHRVIAWRATE